MSGGVIDDTERAKKKEWDCKRKEKKKEAPALHVEAPGRICGTFQLAFIQAECLAHRH